MTKFFYWILGALMLPGIWLPIIVTFFGRRFGDGSGNESSIIEISFWILIGAFIFWAGTLIILCRIVFPT